MALAAEQKERGIRVTISRLPLIDVRFVGAVSVAEYRAMLDHLVSLFEKDTAAKYTMLLDMRDFNPLHINAKMRKEAADVWHENRELYLRVIVAEARVIINPLTRGMITAFDWLTGIGKWPCKQFGRMADAEAWLREAYENRDPFNK